MAILQAVGGSAIVAACVGGIAGVALSVAVSRAIAGLLFGIAPLDAVSYAAAAAFPLRRALNVDPAVSLRAE